MTRTNQIGWLLAVELVAGFSTPQTAVALIDYWDGTGTSWSVASDWSTSQTATTPDPASPPGASDTAYFSTTTVNTAQTVNLNANQSVFWLIFHNSVAMTVQSGSGTNTLTIGGGGIAVDSTAGASMINSKVALSGTQSWIVNASNTLSVDGLISGAGDLGKGGSGNLVLGGSGNSYSGATSIANGTVTAITSNVIPSTSAVTVNNATLDTVGHPQSIGSLTGNGTVIGGNDALFIVGNDNTSPAAFSGSITKSGSDGFILEKVGAGKLTLGGNCDLAGLDAENGTVELTSSGVINSSASVAVAVNAGATLTLDGGSSSVTQSGAAALNIGANIGSQGILNIGTTANGAVFTTGTGLIIIASSGTVNVGSGSINGTLNANGNVSLAGVLAVASSGTFRLAAGKTMTVESGGRASFAGDYSTANATYNIDNTGATGTKLETTGTLDMVNGAQINVSAGGLLSVGQALNMADHISIGNDTLTVDGAGSSATAVTKSTWGSLGNTATITFSNGASGSFNGGVDMAAATSVASHAVLNVQTSANVSFGNLNLAVNNNSAISATININGVGSLVSQIGASTITTGNTSTGPAAINIGTTATGGTLTTGTGLFTINKTGAVTVGSGANTGTLNVAGPVTINSGGTLTVNSGSTATISGAFTGTAISGGGQVNFHSDINPGVGAASATFGGNVALASTAKLNIEIGGTTPGTQFDHVNVTSQLALDGTLSVSLINGFTPVAGNSFDILDWGTPTGTFATLQLPALSSGLMWDTSRLYNPAPGSANAGILSVGLAGDYNSNGVVDAADYVMWRKGLGTIYTQNDYNIWRTHFGQPAGSGAGASANAAVPEPTTLVLLILAAAGWCLRRCRAG